MRLCGLQSALSPLEVVEILSTDMERYALWQSISDNYLFDFAVCTTLLSPGILCGSVLYLLKWPMLTR